MIINRSTENAVKVLKTVSFGMGKKSMTDDALISIAEQLIEKGVIFPDCRPNKNPNLVEATTLQKNMISLIKAKKLSFAELSKITGVPQSSIQRYFSGYTPKIPVEVVEKFAKAFDVSPADLCGWNDRPILRHTLSLAEDTDEKIFEVELVNYNEENIPEHCSTIYIKSNLTLDTAKLHILKEIPEIYEAMEEEGAEGILSVSVIPDEEFEEIRGDIELIYL